MSLPRTLISVLLLGLAATSAAQAVELNTRQGIDNASRNKITSVRLEALLVEQRVGGPVANAQQRRDGCNTEIGNRRSGSLLDRDQPVIVVGDIINVCR